MSLGALHSIEPASNKRSEQKSPPVIVDVASEQIFMVNEETGAFVVASPVASSRLVGSVNPTGEHIRAGGSSVVLPPIPLTDNSGRNVAQTASVHAAGGDTLLPSAISAPEHGSGSGSGDKQHRGNPRTVVMRAPTEIADIRMEEAAKKDTMEALGLSLAIS